MSHDPEVVCVKDPPLPNPRFAAFKEVNGNIVYFMFVEQKTLCSVSSFTKCLVLWFAIHYIFHLGYFHKVYDVALFIQEFVFGLPQVKGGKPKTSSYSVTFKVLQLCKRACLRVHVVMLHS